MNVSNLPELLFSNTLKNYAAKIDTYASTLGMTAEEVTEIKADSIAYTYVTDIQNQVQKHSKEWTAYKNILRSGKKAITTGDFPVWNPPAPPAVTRADINTRFSKMIQRNKNHENFTEAIGHDLGIMSIGEGLTAAEKAVLKPILTIQLVGGQPVIQWKKGHADGIEIHKAEGASGEYRFLEMDLHPHFQDKSPLPAPGQSVVRKYKAIYRINDERVGLWSDEVSVSVMG